VNRLPFQTKQPRKYSALIPILAVLWMVGAGVCLALAVHGGAR
jgi:hypothetical protein